MKQIVPSQAHLAADPLTWEEVYRRRDIARQRQALLQAHYELPFDEGTLVGRVVRLIEGHKEVKAVVRFPTGYHGNYSLTSFGVHHDGRAPQPENASKPARQKHVQQVRHVTVTQVSFLRRVFRG